MKKIVFVAAISLLSGLLTTTAWAKIPAPVLDDAGKAKAEEAKAKPPGRARSMPSSCARRKTKWRPMSTRRQIHGERRQGQRRSAWRASRHPRVQTLARSCPPCQVRHPQPRGGPGNKAAKTGKPATKS
ncbi:MAG: hypothetical protein IPG42_12235 [Betaproteobacteria bacterium]|nr:hypothetical protein [Betaproteobacteria bacterium]